MEHRTTIVPGNRSEAGVSSLSIVLPAFNEAANIAGMIREVEQAIEGLAKNREIIVVDDGSADGTGRLVREQQKEIPSLRLIEHGMNRGSGASYATGCLNATCAWILLTDADRQFDVAEIRDLIPLTHDFDMILGYRAPRRDPFVRRLNGWGWNWLVNTLFGYTARDVDCAFKLFRREAAAPILSRIRSRVATFSVEFVLGAELAGLRICEVPIRGHRPRTAGKQTGARPAVIVRSLGELLRYRTEVPWGTTRNHAPARPDLSG